MSPIDIGLSILLAASFIGLMACLLRREEPKYPDIPFVLSTGFLVLAFGGLLMRHFDAVTGYVFIFTAVGWFAVNAGPVVEKLRKIERGEKV